MVEHSKFNGLRSAAQPTFPLQPPRRHFRTFLYYSDCPSLSPPSSSSSPFISEEGSPGNHLLSPPQMEEALPFPSSKITPPSSSFRLRCPSLNSLRLRRIFDLFDKNCDGVLTLQELNQALTLLGLEPDLSDLDSIISSYVQPGGAGLRFEDFSALHQSLNKIYFDTQGREDGGEDRGVATLAPVTMSQEDSDLSEAFKVFDEDGDGYISAKELQVVLRKLGISEGNEIDRVEKMIVSVDRNHDGRVDFFEFKDMMRSVIVRS